MKNSKTIKIHLIDGIYQEIKVHTDGTIIGKYGNKLAHSDNGSGYKTVSLYTLTKNGKKFHKRQYVHRLVALAFLGDIEGKEINHRDFDRSNNRLDNLEIVTRHENRHWSCKHGRHAHRYGYAQYVIVLGLHFNLKKSVREIIKITGFSRDFIRESLTEQIINRQRYLKDGNIFKVNKFCVSHRDRVPNG